MGDAPCWNFGGQNDLFERSSVFARTKINVVALSIRSLLARQ
jgi:hypothetical protein